jgi:thiamine pyrophosphate-dependent acetolactate synthase large subunit-like protein
VLVTYKAKGVLADAHAQHVGIFTGGTLEAQVVGAADLILLVGADPVEFILQPWRYTAPVAEIAALPFPVLPKDPGEARQQQRHRQHVGGDDAGQEEGSHQSMVLLIRSDHCAAVTGKLPAWGVNAS